MPLQQGILGQQFYDAKRSASHSNNIHTPVGIALYGFQDLRGAAHVRPTFWHASPSDKRRGAPGLDRGDPGSSKTLFRRAYGYWYWGTRSVSRVRHVRSESRAATGSW